MPIFVWEFDHELLFAGNEDIFEVVVTLVILKIIFTTNDSIKVVRVNFHGNFLRIRSKLVEKALDIDKGWSFLGHRFGIFWLVSESDLTSSAFAIFVLESGI